MIWAGAAVPWSYTTALCCGYTRTDYRHLQSCIATLLSCGGCCEVRMADRHLCCVRCVEAFEGQVKPHTVLNKLYWHVTVAKYAAKEWRRSAFFVSRCRQFTLTNWQEDWTVCPVLAKMDGRNVCRGNCPGEDVRGNNCVQGECPTSVSN